MPNRADALQDARRAESEKIRSPLESLRYQRQLLENLRLLDWLSTVCSPSPRKAADRRST